MDESFGEWWWCPECGEPIEVCASYGTCPNSQISKSHVAAEQKRAVDVAKACGDFCGNCKQSYPCGCEEPHQMCGVCAGSLAHECHCTEREFEEIMSQLDPRIAKYVRETSRR